MNTWHLFWPDKNQPSLRLNHFTIKREQKNTSDIKQGNIWLYKPIQAMRVIEINALWNRQYKIISRKIGGWKFKKSLNPPPRLPSLKLTVRIWKYAGPKKGNYRIPTIRKPWQTWQKLDHVSMISLNKPPFPTSCSHHINNHDGHYQELFPPEKFQEGASLMVNWHGRIRNKSP